MIRVQTTDKFAVEFPSIRELEKFINNVGDYVDYLRECGNPGWEEEKAYFDCFVKAYEENK